MSRIGVDLGGTKVEAILVGDNGTVEARERVATPRFDYEATVETVAKLVEVARSNRRTLVSLSAPERPAP